jgi:hypothetical protein
VVAVFRRAHRNTRQTWEHDVKYALASGAAALVLRVFVRTSWLETLAPVAFVAIVWAGTLITYSIAHLIAPEWHSKWRCTFEVDPNPVAAGGPQLTVGVFPKQTPYAHSNTGFQCLIKPPSGGQFWAVNSLPGVNDTTWFLYPLRFRDSPPRIGPGRFQIEIREQDEKRQDTWHIVVRHVMRLGDNADIIPKARRSRRPRASRSRA